MVNNRILRGAPCCPRFSVVGKAFVNQFVKIEASSKYLLVTVLLLDVLITQNISSHERPVSVLYHYNHV